MAGNENVFFMSFQVFKKPASTKEDRTRDAASRATKAWCKPYPLAGLWELLSFQLVLCHSGCFWLRESRRSALLPKVWFPRGCWGARCFFLLFFFSPLLLHSYLRSSVSAWGCQQQSVCWGCISVIHEMVLFPHLLHLCGLQDAAWVPLWTPESHWDRVCHVYVPF